MKGKPDRRHFGPAATTAMKKRLMMITLLLAALLLPLFAAGADAAGTEEGRRSAKETISLLRDPAGPVLGAALCGLPADYPENALEGILAAGGTGIDLVLADVSSTADGGFVLMKTDAPGRMLADADPAKPLVSDYTTAELTAVYLLKGYGGKGNDKSEYRPATLEAALKAVKEKDLPLILRCDAADAKGIADMIKANGAADICALLVTGNKKAAKHALTSSDTGGVCTLGELRSNIFFEVTSRIKTLTEAGAAGLVLKTTNRYGVNFHQTVLRRFTGMRAAIDLGDAETAGARADCETWWDDLIARGYSLIFTEEPAAFADYLARCRENRAALQEAYDRYVTNAAVPAFKQNLLNDYKKAYTDAVHTAERLLNDPQAANAELTDAVTALHTAYKNIALHYDELEKGTAGVTVTPVRIFLCVAAAAAVFWVERYFYKKRKPVRPF